MRRLAALVVLAFCPAIALADGPCAALSGETIFHCQIQGSTKALTVCERPDGAFHYAYGRANDPDLTLDRTVADLAYRPWNGVGFSYWASLTFENEGYRYEVWFDAIKDGSQPVTGGVHIYAPGVDQAGGRPTAEQVCRTGTVETRLDEIEDRFE